MPGRRARKKANYTNMSRRELHNIKMMVAPPIHTDHQKDKLERKALSDARVAKWPNTLEAMRRNKDEARNRRLEAEEAERLKEDKRLAAARAQDPAQGAQGLWRHGGRGRIGARSAAPAPHR